MNFLMDTHTLIWVMEDHKNLSTRAKKAIQDTSNNIFVSTVNLWEISLKTSINKLVVNGVELSDLPILIGKMDFHFFSLNEEDAASFYLLEANYHKDPFDRMLIWQAIRNKFTLITKDSVIKKYEEVGLKTFW